MAHPIGPNPFAPSFGGVPLIHAGCDSLLRDAEVLGIAVSAVESFPFMTS